MQALVYEKNAVQYKVSILQTMQIPECPVCWDLFDDGARMPRILRCGHTICESCLEYLPVDSRLGQRCLHCPECRSPCLWRGVRELPKNFILLRVMSKDSQREEAAVTNVDEGYLLGMFFELPVLFSLLHFISAETRWLQQMVKRKLWDVTKLFCLAAMLLMLVPVSLAHMVLAWWVASLGFLILLWFTAGGFGLAAFILGLWVSYNVLHIFLRLNRSFHRKLTDTGY